MVTREELTAERIEQIVEDARKAGYDFFLSAEQRAASLAQALTRYAPGDEAWVFAYGSLMWNPALEYAEASTCHVQGWHRSFCFWTPLGRGTPDDLPVRAGDVAPVVRNLGDHVANPAEAEPAPSPGGAGAA